MDHTKRQPRRMGWRFAFLALLLAVAISGLVRSLWLDVYYIPSESMEPLLQGGDRILVSRTDFRAEPVRRGDIVVFDGRGTFAPLNSGKGPLADAAAAAAQWLGLAGSRCGFRSGTGLVCVSCSVGGGCIRAALMAGIRDPGVVLGHLLSVLCCWSCLLRP